MTNRMLLVENLTLSFGAMRVVDRLSFGVTEGEIVSLIGPNGAGKTSAFNCLSGVYRPQQGLVALDGRTISGLPPSGVAARGIARTFQNLRLFPRLSVLDNVRAGLHRVTGQNLLDVLLHTARYHRSEAESTAVAADWLRYVGYSGATDRPVGDLSYGDQRRVELARALAARPRLLLLDEPAAGLNHGEKAVLADLITDIRRSGVTVLLIEHDMGLVMRISDRIVVLDRGARIAEGPPARIREDPRVIEAYLGTEEDDDVDA
ncbi:ABC transporter ATP-binding protein [Longispora urticae]